MHRVRTTLRNRSYPILVLAGINVLLILCMCVLLSRHSAPKYGFHVKPAETQFTLGRYDRNNMQIITIAPGEQPRFYIQGKRIKDSWAGVETLLESWKSNNPSRLTVILVQDEAVSMGTTQRMMNLIKKHGYNVRIQGSPTLN